MYICTCILYFGPSYLVVIYCIAALYIYCESKIRGQCSFYVVFANQSGRMMPCKKTQDIMKTTSLIENPGSILRVAACLCWLIKYKSSRGRLCTVQPTLDTSEHTVLYI